MSAFAREQELASFVARDLSRAEPELRESALDRLGSLAGDHVEIIAGRLDDPDPEVRGAAAVNLGRVRRPGAWPRLLRASHAESSDEVQRHIVAALAPYHDDAILSRLLELLARRDGDYRVRMEIAVQLWRYEPEIVIPVIIDLVRGEDDDIVRAHAAETLELLDELDPGARVPRELWHQLVEDGRGAARVAERALGREAAGPAGDVLSAIARRLRHPAAEERSFALDRLSMLAPAPAMTLAQPLLDDEAPRVRAACCGCLGAIRDEAAIPLLLTALRTEEAPQVKTAALIGLESYHAAEIGSALLQQLEAGSCTGGALSILCRQLWKYPSARSVELLRRTLSSKAELPHRWSVESSLALLEQLLSA